MKKLSWGSFFIGAGAGFVVGALVLGVIVNYLVSNAISGKSTNDLLLGGSVEQVREGILNVRREQERTMVYGSVVSIGEGTLVLQVANTDGPKEYTFTYDNNTEFVYLANDTASSEQPLSSDEIVAGERLHVTTKEAVGSVTNQYAVKILKI